MNQVQSINQRILYIGTYSQNIQIKDELKAIQNSMDANDSNFWVDYRPVEQITDVSNAIQNTRISSIIHISGHGQRGGKIEILDPGEAGKGEALEPDVLVQFLKNTGNVICVLLNFCYSKEAADLIAKEAQNVGCVIGINGDISSTAAVDFSKAFYKSLQGELLNNQSVVQNAFQKGKAAALPRTEEDTYNIIFSSTFNNVSIPSLIYAPDYRLLDRTSQGNNINIWLDKSGGYITLNWSVTEIDTGDYVALYDHSANGNADSYLEGQWQWIVKQNSSYVTDMWADSKAYWIAYGGKRNGDYFIKAQNGPFFL